MNLNEKLLAIKSAVRHIKPDKKGYGYDYASPSKVLGVFNPLFEEHKLLLTCEIEEVKLEKFDSTKGQDLKGETALKYGSDILHVVKMIFTFTDLESGEEKRIPWAGVGSNGTEQGFGSALTYGERYFLVKFFGIPVDKDDPNQIKSVQAPEKTLKKMTARDRDGMLKALERGNFPIVRTLLATFEDGPMKKEIESKLPKE